MNILAVCRAIRRQLPVQVRGFVKVGDVVPIKYLKDEPAPVIKPDSEYPEWLFTITQPLPTRNAIIKQVNTLGIRSITRDDARRLKKVANKERIRRYNMEHKKEKKSKPAAAAAAAAAAAGGAKGDKAVAPAATPAAKDAKDKKK